MTNWQLQPTPKGLILQKAGSKSSLWIDFSDKKLTYRREHASLRKEALAKAAGLRHGSNPILLDVTAGLGQDAFIIASLGFQIYLLERSPIVHSLLEDAIQRGNQDENIAPITQRMKLIHADSLYFLEHPSIIPDIIFLDPMFPARKKTAKPGISMQIFHEVIGENNDADRLFEKSLACATQKVVVKRPRLAPPLKEQKPHFTLDGSSCRFDVYLTGKNS
ncbi:MAG: class I SAM-dependent methyltransferase [Gammaproteobacteria bacterium]|nr:class I SAM-dependent methyltransferase [Gammaproteobacteria bacterium]